MAPRAGLEISSPPGFDPANLIIAMTQGFAEELFDSIPILS